MVGHHCLEPVGERRQAKIPKNFGEDAAITYPFLIPVIFFCFFFLKHGGKHHSLCRAFFEKED